MRIAVILAILARTTDVFIFKPTYLLEEDSGFRELLFHQAVIHSKKESFCRALLLGIFPDQQAKTATDRVSIVVHEVIRIVQDLLTVTKAEAFRSDLEGLTQPQVTLGQIHISK